MISNSERNMLYSFWDFFYKPFWNTKCQYRQKSRIEIRFCRFSDFDSPERTFFGLSESESKKVPAFALAMAEYFPHQIHFCPAPEVLSDLSEGTGKRLSTGFWADFDLHEDEKNVTLDTLINMDACAVLSSGSGLHAYWRADNIDEIRFHLLKNGFAEAFGADSNIEIDHMMRFPCTMNFKYCPARSVRFLHFKPTVTSFEKLSKHVESVLGTGWMKEEERREREKQEAKLTQKSEFRRDGVVFSFGDITFDELFSEGGILRTFSKKTPDPIACTLTRRAIECPEELSYKEWVTVGALLRKAFPNDEERMKEIFHEVSTLSVRYNEAECSKVWQYIVDKDFKGWNCDTLGVCDKEQCRMCHSHFTLSGTAATRLKARRKKSLESAGDDNKQVKTQPKEQKRTIALEDRRDRELNRVEALFESVCNSD